MISRIRMWTIVICSSILVAGCSSSSLNTPNEAMSPASSEASSHAWKSEFDQLLSNPSSSDTLRRVLADYRIADSEISDLQDRLRECLKPAGVVRVDFSNSEAKFETNTPDRDPDEFVADLDRCDEEVGYTTAALLYFSILNNPNHVDRTQDLVACLIDKGLLPGDYDAEQYRKDLEAGRFPVDFNDANAELFVECDKFQ